MKKNELKDPHELQAYFNKRLLKILEKYNKKMVGWDEILQPGMPENIVIQSWRGKESLYQSAKEGYQGILSNGYYIDLMQRASQHYLNDPLPQGTDLDEESKKRILGGEATMWSELVTLFIVDSRIWPRTAAIAERFWSPSSVDDVDEMYRRLDIIGRQIEELHLTHIKNRDVILRNLCKCYKVEPLMNLANVAEPLEGYKRNSEGKYYTSYSPFTLFADVTIADAPDARAFNELVEKYLNGDNGTKEEITKWLELWGENHDMVKEMIKESPVLKEIESLSENLKRISDLALTSLKKQVPAGKKERSDWLEKSKKALTTAREQGGRTELVVVDAVEKLIKYETEE